MALRILVDECLRDELLTKKLRKAGHDVETAASLNLRGMPDQLIVDAAKRENRLILTLNCSDFLDISKRENSAGKIHPGFLLVFQYNNPQKDLSYDEIVAAISNLEASQVKLDCACHSLNRYRY